VCGWVLIARRVRPVVSVPGVALVLLSASWLTDEVRLIGPFAERAGSDALRQRIVELEHVRIDAAPWYGSGPGTSTVDVEGATFFFHNSYLGLRNEAGWVAVVLLVLLGLCLLWSLASGPVASRNLWVEGALISVAACALNLGEVLLELPAAVAIGVAAHHLASRGAAPSLESVRPEASRWQR
jgi:hypothetical protein